jgi:hypothetical protein
MLATRPEPGLRIAEYFSRNEKSLGRSAVAPH